MTVNEVISWHRQEARRHQEQASFHKRTADMMESENRETSVPEVGRELTTPPTLVQFEDEMKIKRGRVAHVAKRLNTTEAEIESLLKNPDCNYAVGDRGFIYTKDEVKAQKDAEK